MTAQIGDRYRYKDEEYTIVSRSAPMDVHPVQFKILPKKISTACVLGYWCVYNITDGGIFLEDLYVNAKNGIYPPIHGVCAERKDMYMGHHRYVGLHLGVPYTGKLLGGRERVPGWHNMGYPRPWAYRELVELVFENGKLVQANDQSHIAEAIRRCLDAKGGSTGRVCKRYLRIVDGKARLESRAKIWWL